MDPRAQPPVASPPPQPSPALTRTGALNVAGPQPAQAYSSLPPRRDPSKAKLLWAVGAVVLVVAGLDLMLSIRHSQTPLGISTTTPNHAPTAKEQAYLDDLHRLSEEIPAMYWGKSDRELLGEGYVVCAELNADPRGGWYRASQKVQAWGNWPFNPDPVVLSPAPGSEDRELPIVLPGMKAAPQTGQLIILAEQHLCPQRK